MTQLATVQTWAVTLTSPLLDGPLEADVPASTAHAACTRLRFYAFHEYREASMLRADCVATDPRPIGASS